mmetsp:Transcript_13745/g.37196  ORF Transcript_13745/g.37196 Transcript_13745/m.37196 type:complete len:229 (-) Transcript_13745:491-1177(-)
MPRRRQCTLAQRCRRHQRGRLQRRRQQYLMWTPSWPRSGNRGRYRRQLPPPGRFRGHRQSSCLRGRCAQAIKGWSRRQDPLRAHASEAAAPRRRAPSASHLANEHRSSQSHKGSSCSPTPCSTAPALAPRPRKRSPSRRSAQCHPMGPGGPTRRLPNGAHAIPASEQQALYRLANSRPALTRRGVRRLPNRIPILQHKPRNQPSSGTRRTWTVARGPADPLPPRARRS